MYNKIVKKCKIKNVQSCICTNGVEGDIYAQILLVKTVLIGNKPFLSSETIKCNLLFNILLIYVHRPTNMQ